MATGIERLNARTGAAEEKQKQAWRKPAKQPTMLRMRRAGTRLPSKSIERRFEKHLAVVRGWDAQLEANETTGAATESQRQLGEVTQETGEKQATAGEQAEVAGQQQEQRQRRSAHGLAGLRRRHRGGHLPGRRTGRNGANLDQLRQQAEAAIPPIDRLREAIAAASSTDQLDQVVAAMGRLREEGLLTEEQYRELTEAVLEQAEAMREATTATDDQADSLNRVSREAVDAAGNLEQVGNAARGAGEAGQGIGPGLRRHPRPVART